MKSHLFLVITVLYSLYAAANDDTRLSVNTINPALLERANVVKRSEEIVFEIKSTNETFLKKKYALTILNEKGDEQAQFVQWYDKLQKIVSIEGSLYDASGKLIKTLKAKDIQDRSALQDISLIDDNRIKMHHFYHRQYPYTVVYEVEVKYHHSFYFPRWIPQDGEDLAVEKSTFSIVTPEAYNFRYRSFHFKGTPSITAEKGKKITTWQVSSLPAFKKPYAAPVWNELTTAVYFAPTDFEVEGYKGNMNSWQEFGKFVYALKKDRDKLPDAIVQKVKDLTAGLSSEKEKINVLYRYLQQNTRYISIQLGIGGWQPFDAAYVAQKGYGDCKALTNYMYSLLKAAGIRSLYTLVNAGNSRNDRYLLEDFPSQQFNHVILCVPLQKDTVWLECTSGSTPSGYMGGFTGNRKALVIDENGGVLVSTPKYSINENVQVRQVKGTIDDEGNLLAKVETRYSALQQDELQSMLSSVSKEKVKTILNEELGLSTYTINDFQYAEKKDLLPEVHEGLNLEVSNYATISGKRLFITPNLLNRSATKINEEETRLCDYEFGYAYRDADSIEITIPDGYVPEAAPQNVSIKTKYGTYTSSVKLLNNKLVYYRFLEQYAGKYSPSEGPEIAKYYVAIYKADRSRVVLVKKE